jgi:hypothetical protein
MEGNPGLFFQKRRFEATAKQEGGKPDSGRRPRD